MGSLRSGRKPRASSKITLHGSAVIRFDSPEQPTIRNAEMPRWSRLPLLLGNVNRLLSDGRASLNSGVSRYAHILRFTAQTSLAWAIVPRHRAARGIQRPFDESTRLIHDSTASHSGCVIRSGHEDIKRAVEISSIYQYKETAMTSSVAAH